MRLEMTGSVVDNEPGAQVYFREQFHDQPAFPLCPGRDEFRAICVPAADAIVLVDADRDLEYPLELTIRDPDSYRISIEPADTTDSETTKWP